MKRTVMALATAAAVSAVLAAGLTPASRLQAQSPPSPAFDVASVKRNNTPGGAMMRNVPGSVTAVGVAVIQLIRQAYQVQEFQIVGGPDWMKTDRFDIDAKFDATTPVPGFEGPARLQAMLRTLLADRFQLAAHTETREMPIYALALARSDGRLGPQLTPSAADCAALARAGGPPPDGRRGGPPPDGRRGGGPGPDGRGAPPPPGAPVSLGERPPCGGRSGFGQMLGGGIVMPQLAQQLSNMTGRVVVDRTGLTGGYDFDLKWTPTPDQLPAGPPPPGIQPPPIDPDGPSLFTALQEQLGLKLDAQRGPVDVLVIDRLEPPAEN